MTGYEAQTFTPYDLSVALTEDVDRQLAQHLGQHVVRGERQEDLTFAYWRPSIGKTRYTAILFAVALPNRADRILQGNVAFMPDYIGRVLDERPKDAGIALLHSHLGPGWQDMSRDDVVAEHDRLAGLVAGTTGLPLVGLTWGTDGEWSARFWFRTGRHQYARHDASSVRSVGQRLRMSFHPRICPAPATPPSQEATISVWGPQVQHDLARTQVGIVGLGSVGSLVAEALSRTGFSRMTLIDMDKIETRNLDRTLGAHSDDVRSSLPKVDISERLISKSHTSATLSTTPVRESIVTPAGLVHALDCDVLVSCVDRPWPRHVLNAIAYSHLIPVVDGGIFARLRTNGSLLHVDWRVHTSGPGRACLYCIGALRRGDAALDRDGLLDDPDYMAGLTEEDREQYKRRNVFAFSLSVAAHQVLQLVGLVSGNSRVCGIGPQMYHAFPGTMDVEKTRICSPECDLAPILASALSPM